MTTAVIPQSIAGVSPRLLARMTGLCYVVNVVTSLIAFTRTGGLAPLAGVVATIFYIAVTVLLYRLFKPVNNILSLIAAAFSFLGCLPGILNPFHVTLYRINSLVFFGIYCLMIGYLILKSIFLPHIFGMGMILAGLGWLTFISRSLAESLSPYNYYPGGIGEISFCLWLLVMGVNERRWKEQAGEQVAPQ